MAYIDIDIEDYIDEISTSVLENELERRKSKGNKTMDVVTTSNGYQREVLRTFKELMDSNVNLLELNKLMQTLL